MVSLIENRCYEITKFGTEGLQISSRQIKPLEPNEVLIEFDAWSLNYRDFMMLNGIYNPNLKFPLIPLSDGSGIVIEIGSEVENFKIGDRVCPNFMLDYESGPLLKKNVQSALGGAIDGVLATKLKFKETALVKMPKYLSATQAATLPCAALTAWTALYEYSNVAPGDTILTFGSGGVSLFVIQFAKLSGAKVVVVSAKEEKFEDLKKLGATHCINYQTDKNWEDSVIKLVGQVDHVIELGGAKTIERSLKCLKFNGTISLIGVLAGLGTFNPISVLMKAVKINGIFVGNRQMFERMVKALEFHRLKPVIDSHSFSFEQAPDAFNYICQSKHFGKIVISNSKDK